MGMCESTKGKKYNPTKKKTFDGEMVVSSNDKNDIDFVATNSNKNNKKTEIKFEAQNQAQVQLNN